MLARGRDSVWPRSTESSSSTGAIFRLRVRWAGELRSRFTCRESMTARAAQLMHRRRDLSQDCPEHESEVNDREAVARKARTHGPQDQEELRRLHDHEGNRVKDDPGRLDKGDEC